MAGARTSTNGKPSTKRRPGAPKPAATSSRHSKRSRRVSRPTSAAAEAAGPALLSGGNPQIARADGEAPVQAYFEALSGWQRRVGDRLDAIITRCVPQVRKAVKWNSPFYGIPGQGWFVALHTFTRYLKVSFFAGTSLCPVPPGGTGKTARWIDVHEHDLDEARMVAWIRQAAGIAGWLTADIRTP